MQAIIQGLERTAFLSLAIGEDDRYIGLDRLAQKIWARYQDKIDRNPAAQIRVSLPPMKQLRQFVLTPLLYQEAPPLLAAQLRTALDQIGVPIPPPPETNAAPVSGDHSMLPVSAKGPNGSLRSADLNTGFSRRALGRLPQADRYREGLLYRHTPGRHHF